MSPSVAMFVRNDLANDSRVWKEARALRDAGWRVSLFGVRTPGRAHAEEVEGITVRRVTIRPLDTRLLRRGRTSGDAPAFAASGGAPSWRSRARRYARARWEPLHERLTEAEFSRQAVDAAGPHDVYHAHDLNAARPALELRRRHGGRVVFDAHEFFSERNFYYAPTAWERFAIRRREGQVCRSADAVVTVSESIADALQRRYRLPSRPAVVMNAPQLAAAKTPPPRAPGAGPVVLYLGAVTWNRGIEQAAAALAELPGASLVLQGPVQRGFRPVVEAAARRAGTLERVEFRAPVPPDDVVAAAQSADVAVALIQNACLSYYYCSPNKVFEALTAGVPVVASDFPDLRRVLAGSPAGALCDPADPRAIAAAVKAVLARPREETRAAARALAAGYAWPVQAAKLLAVYQPWFSPSVRL